MQTRLSEGQLIVNAYKVLSLIGEGGFGVVYKALQLDLQRIVAIKILKEAYVESEDLRARFQREGRVLATLKHPNIVVCYTAGLWHAQVPFLVFEYLEGKSLRQILKVKQTLSIKASIDLGIQTCKALAYAHAANIVHRDLKPENIMFVAGEKEGSIAKILDFGLAAVLEESQRLTKSGLLVGTAGYVSPEQCRGKAIDLRSDIYAVGCILYECITGVPPHNADTPMALLFKHLNEYPKRISELAKDSPAALDILIIKSMAKDPADRYQSAGEMCADLQKLKDALEKEEELDTNQIIISPALLRASSQARRKSFKSYGIVISLALLAIAGGVVFLVSDPEPAPLLVWSASFCPQKDRLAFLERAGDEMACRKRDRAANILYAEALHYCVSSSEKLPLISKMSLIALNSGRKGEAAMYAAAYFEMICFRVTQERKCTMAEIDSFKRILSVIETVPIVWKTSYEFALRALVAGPFDKSYPLDYNVNFALTILDSTESDRHLNRLKDLFLTIIATEFHNDTQSKSRIISWAQEHLGKFGGYKRFLELILSKVASEPTSATGKGSLMQTVINVSAASGNSDSSERTCLLLAAARTLTSISLDKREAFNADKLRAFARAREASEATLVSNLLIALAFESKGDYVNYVRSAREAVMILSKLEDKENETMSLFQPLKLWVFKIMSQSIVGCLPGTPGRLELLNEFDKSLSGSPRYADLKVRKGSWPDLYNMSLSLQENLEAEETLRENKRRKISGNGD